MFYVYKNRLIIAPSNMPYSHAEWFVREGFMSKNDDDLMNTIVRGIVTRDKEIYFYVGHDFNVTAEAESEFFCHLKELQQALSLKDSTLIYGGAIKDRVGSQWTARKNYGEVRQFIR